MNDNEYKQRVTIANRGDVAFTKYKYTDAGRVHSKAHMIHYSISKDIATLLIELIVSSIGGVKVEDVKDDGFSWELEITYSNGTRHKYHGPMGISIQTDKGDLSERIRKIIWQESAILFDGKESVEGDVKNGDV